MDYPQRLQGLIGVALLLTIAFALSNNRRRIDWKLVAWGLALQLTLAVIILRTPIGQPAFNAVNAVIGKLIDCSNEGAKFLFKPLNPHYVESYDVVPDEVARATNEQVDYETPPDSDTASDADDTADEGQPAAGSRLHLTPVDGDRVAFPLINIAFIILPTVIFFSALLAVLYHIGVMERVVRAISFVMQWTMRTSGAETLCVAGNIFVGQTEAPLLVRPFLKQMTKSELMTVMVGGFATVAGGVLALYVLFLKHIIPDIAGHLAAASVMSAPAAIVMAKIIFPETEVPVTSGKVAINVERTARNTLEAFGEGVTQGMLLVLNIGAMLLAFFAIIALINALLGLCPDVLGEPLSMQRILGQIFRPIAWSIGTPWDESQFLGTLLGEKLTLTELVAYTHLGQAEVGPQWSRRSAIIASYALCGFANFASIGIQLGGIGSLAPERKGDIADLALRAMIGGALASWLTAAIVGLLI